MIYDHLGRKISSESIVDTLRYPPAKNQQAWDKFHLDYVSQVGKIVGFKRPADIPKLTKPERKLFERIFAEYHSQNGVQELFGSYELFFQSLFVNSYGIHLQEDQYVDGKLSLEQRLNSPLKEQERNEIKDELKRVDFTRNINLPLLLYCCLEEKVKKPKHHFKRDFDFTYQINGEKKVETRLRPEFSSNVWENIFNSHDDCINITVRNNDGGSFNAQLQKYWFASMLHYLHPKIQYLNFRAPSKEAPTPLFRVKLMEALDEKRVKYCIVGGVLGEDFKKIKTKGIEEYVDSCIREFFLTNYSKKDRLLYNLNHMPDETKPYNQFIEFIRKKYSLDENKLKVIKEVNGKKCTHSVKVPWEDELITKISNVDLDGDDKYHGEQYSETFEMNKLKGSLGAFVRLEDVVRGFDVSYSKTKKGRQHHFILLAAAVLGISGIAGGLWLAGESYVPCLNAKVEDMAVECNIDGKKTYIYPDELENVRVNGETAKVITESNQKYSLVFENKSEEQEFLKSMEWLDEFKEQIAPIIGDIKCGFKGSLTQDQFYQRIYVCADRNLRAPIKAKAVIDKYKAGNVINSSNTFIVQLQDSAISSDGVEIIRLIDGFLKPEVYERFERLEGKLEGFVAALPINRMAAYFFYSMLERNDESLLGPALDLIDYYTQRIDDYISEEDKKYVHKFITEMDQKVKNASPSEKPHQLEVFRERMNHSGSFLLPGIRDYREKVSYESMVLIADHSRSFDNILVLKLLELQNKWKEYPDSGDIAIVFEKIVLNALKDYNGPDSITSPMPIRDILGMCALMFDGLKSYNTQTGITWSMDNLIKIVSEREDTNWLYKALSFSQMTKNNCVYNKFKTICKDLNQCADTCNVRECQDYTKKVMESILYQSLSPEEIQDKELPYTLGLCQK